MISDLVGYFDVMDACIEDQYLGKNANSMKILTRISGRWHEACCVRDLDVTWVSPRAWQTKILGAKWGSQRKQIDKMMKIIAQQDTQTKLTADQCAAWCIGKYHIFESHTRYVLQRSKPKMGR
jgi:Holliday junction resolvasome RuvABC endonuclease subunit